MNSVYLIPFIAAAIGWLTNWIAIKMLFHPRKEMNLGLFRLQGIFPKRKAVLAEKLGTVVDKELFSMAMISEKLTNPQTQEQLMLIVHQQLDNRLADEIKSVNPMIAMFLTPELLAQIKAKIANQFAEMTPKMIEQLGQTLESIDVQQMVKERVMNFSDQKLEDILMSVMQKELKFIEIAGGVLGFIIGLLQSLLVLLEA
jgi:uncharacterized membrane protein YheB (UPF0754 family)